MTIDPRSVQVWADVRCPWCWIGHRRLAEARGVFRRDDRDMPAVVHRAFLLEPAGPQTSGITVREAALGEWGMSAGDWEASRDRIEAAGDAEGLEIRMDTARIFDSRDAHRLLKMAADAEGVDVERAWDTVFDLHFRRNVDLGDAAVLMDAAVEIGLEPTAVEELMAGGGYRAQVEHDHEEARRLGIRSVPTVVASGDHLSGSRSVSEIVRLLAGANVVTS